MDVEPLKLPVDSKAAQQDLARLSAALEKTATSWDKMEAALVKGANATDASLKKSMTSVENFAQVASIASRIKINAGGAQGLSQFAAAMNAASKIKAIDASKIKGMQEFARAASMLKVPAGASRLAEFGNAMANLKAPSASAIVRMKELFTVLNSFRAPRSSGSLAALFASLANMKVPSAAAVSRLELLFKTLSNAKAIPNAGPIAASLNAVAAAAGHAGNAISTLPPHLRTLNTGFVQAEKQASLFRRTMQSLSAVSIGGNRGNAMYQVGTLFTSMFSAVTLGEFVRNVSDATNNALSLQKALFFVTGTVKGTQDGVNAFNKTVFDLGLNLKETQGPFSRFVISAREAGLSMKDSQKVFGDVALALRTVGASNEQQTQSFYALQEMLAKGKVQAKEFTRQLAQYIPGAAAFGAAALAQMRGVPETIADFYKQMKAGTIEAGPFVKNFGEILKTQFQPLQELMKLRPDYAINRFKSSLQLFYQAVGKNSMQAMVSSLNGFTDSMVKNGQLTGKYAALAQKLGQNMAEMATAVGKAAMWAANHLDLITMAIKGFIGLKLTATVFTWVTAMGAFASKMALQTASTTAASAANTRLTATAATQTAALNADTVALNANAAAKMRNSGAGVNLGGFGKRGGGIVSPTTFGGTFGKRVSSATGEMSAEEMEAAGAAQRAATGVKMGSAARAGVAGAEGIAEVGAAEAGVGAAAGVAEGAVGGLLATIGAATGVLEVAVVVVGGLAAAWFAFKDSQIQVGKETTNLAGLMKAAGEEIADAWGDKNGGGFLAGVHGWLDGLGESIDGWYEKHKTGIDNIIKIGEQALVTTLVPGGQATMDVIGAGADRVGKRAEKDAADKRAKAQAGADQAAGNTLIGVDEMLGKQEIMSRQIAQEEIKQQAEALGKEVSDTDLEAMTLKKQMATASQRYGFDPGFLSSVNNVESPGSPQQRKGSKYAGYFQFGDDAWLQTLKKYGKNYSPELGDFADKDIVDLGKGHMGINAPGASLEQNKATLQAVLGWRMRNPGLNAEMAGAELQSRTVALRKDIGRDPSSGESYLTWLLGESGAKQYITKSQGDPNGNATSLVDSIFHGQKIGEANPSIFSDKGRARTNAQVMTALREMIKGNGKLNLEDEDPAKVFAQYTEQLTGYAGLVGVANPSLQRQVKLREFDAKAEKLKAESAKMAGTIDPATGKPVGNFYNQNEVDEARSREVELQRRADHPLAYDNELAAKGLEIEQMKLKGFTDEAAWKDKLNKLDEQGIKLGADEINTEHKKFLEMEAQTRVMKAQADLQGQRNSNLLRDAVDAGATPEQQKLFGLIDQNYQGGSIQDKIARARKDGTYSTYSTQAHEGVMSDAGHAVSDIQDSLKEQQSMVGMNALQRERQTMLHDELASLTQSKGTTEDLLGLAKSYTGEMYGSYKNAAALAEAITNSKMAMAHPPGFQAWVQGLEPFAQRLEDIKKNFAESLSQGITDALMGKKVKWGDLFQSIRAQLMKAQVDQTLGDAFKGWKSKNGGTPGVGGVLGGLDSAKSPNDEAAAALVSSATTLQGGADTLQIAATTLLQVAQNASAGASAGGGGARAAGMASTPVSLPSSAAVQAPVTLSDLGSPSASFTAATHNWNALANAQPDSTDASGLTGASGLPGVGATPDFLPGGTISVPGVTSTGGGFGQMPSPISVGGSMNPSLTTDLGQNFGQMLTMPTPMATGSSNPLAMLLGGGAAGVGGNMLSGMMGGASGAMGNLLKLGALSALGNLLTPHTHNQTQVTRKVNGMIGESRPVTVTGKQVAAQANPVGEILTFIADAALGKSGIGGSISNAIAPQGSMLGSMNSFMGGMFTNPMSTMSNGFGSIFSSIFGGGASAGAGDLSSLAGLFREGGYSTSPVSTQMASMASWRDAPHYSEGTPNTSGIHAILHPDEAVIPLSKGRKIPVDMGNSGVSHHTTVNSPIYVTTPDANSFRASDASISRKQNRTLRRASVRNLTASGA